MIFWDSSAIVPLLVLGEPRQGELAALIEEDAGVVVWWGTVVECAAAIARAERDASRRELAARARRALPLVARAWDEVQPSDEVREAAQLLLRRHPLRAADALQLAAATVWSRGRPAGHRFCCLDDRLNTAATVEGFVVVPEPQ
jgi:uncharacterized protein